MHSSSLSTDVCGTVVKYLSIKSWFISLCQIFVPQLLSQCWLLRLKAELYLHDIAIRGTGRLLPSTKLVYVQIDRQHPLCMPFKT